ncbi:MAG: NAD(+)/NADH kinase [Oscillospiraceae bacterium]|nr:NAD(+)/NADH kinase [Oscillospiraceae bacterium]
MIALCPNPFRDLDLKLTRDCLALLEQAGFSCAICPVFADDEPEALPGDLRYEKLTEIAPDCTLAIVIGGDGTILSVVRQLRSESIPMLGINLGTKGFMANLEAEDLDRIVPAAKGEYRLSRRMMLEVELHRNGEVICRDHALNDVVLHGYGDCIGMTTYCSGDRVSQFSGDGIILSTPTGSTGYSMSAGGPIVEPEAENIIISPICPHVMGARTFVLDPQRTVTVTAERLHGRRAYLAVDGISVADLAGGDEILVRRSPHYTLMADLGLKSFYDIAYEKLR